MITLEHDTILRWKYLSQYILRSDLPFFCPHCIGGLNSTLLSTSTPVSFSLSIFFHMKGSHFTIEIPSKEVLARTHLHLLLLNFILLLTYWPLVIFFFLHDTLSHCHPENTCQSLS